MYNKLFTKILDSSIWLEPMPVRIVWVTFLAMMDQDGAVALSGIGNVANRARVTEEEAALAIKILESPDERNPGQDRDGRRIERIPGVGWMVLNSKKYRDIIKAETSRAQTRERVRKHRHGNAVTKCNENVTPSDAVSVSESETGKTPQPLKNPDILDGMDQDEVKIELAQPLPPAPLKENWRDWRAMHGQVYVAKRGEDGDGADWEGAWKFYGKDCFDPMYKRLTAANPGKPIYFNLAVKWLEQNTKEVPDGTPSR